MSIFGRRNNSTCLHEFNCSCKRRKKFLKNLAPSQPFQLVTITYKAEEENIIEQPIDESSGINIDFSTTSLDSLNTINTDYLQLLATKQYANIPSEFSTYIELYDSVYGIQKETTNENLSLLLDIALNGLKGSVETQSLFTQNISLALNNNVLENRIDEILSGKNETTAMSSGTGTLQMTKTFTLAPLFSYYIVVFGMPAYGVGFDPKKLSIILDILNENGIDPYD